MPKILYRMTENGDIEHVVSGALIGIKTLTIIPGTRGDSVEINKGVEGAKYLRTRRCHINESAFSLNAFKADGPPQIVPVPKAPVEKVGETFIVGLTKEELKDMHAHHQAVADMLFRKIVQVALKEG